LTGNAQREGESPALLWQKLKPTQRQGLADLAGLEAETIEGSTETTWAKLPEGTRTDLIGAFLDMQGAEVQWGKLSEEERGEVAAQLPSARRDFNEAVAERTDWQGLPARARVQLAALMREREEAQVAEQQAEVQSTDGNMGRPDAAQGADAASTQNKPTAAFAKAYGGKAAYEKARAEGKTELTYHQWLQVRTEAFEAWFGDWEAVRAQDRVDAMQPVKVTVPDEWRGLPVEELRKEALKKLKALVGDKRTGEGFTEITHPELGVIRVDSRGFKKTRSASADPAKILVAADVQNLIPQAIYSRSEGPDAGSAEGLEGASKLLARVSVDGVELVALFTILREADGHWYYNTVTLADENGRARGSITEHDRQAESSTASITGLAGHKRDSLRRVNPESVSKAINPRTGEPLVVYHSTGEDFSIFDITKSRSWTGQPDYDLPGFYFTDDAGQAADYGQTQIAAYLSMQHPFAGNVLGYKNERGLAT